MRVNDRFTMRCVPLGSVAGADPLKFDCGRLSSTSDILDCPYQGEIGVDTARITELRPLHRTLFVCQ